MSSGRGSLTNPQVYSLTSFNAMQLYIDEENLRSLLQEKSQNEELFFDFLKYVKERINVQYNFPKETLRSTDSNLTYWLGKAWGEGVKTSSSFCSPQDVYPARPISTGSFSRTGLQSLCSAYLLNISAEEGKKFRDMLSILIGTVGEEYNMIRELSAYDNKECLAKDIKQWSDFCPTLPVTDVILDDNYYFVNKERYDKSKNEILTAIAANARKEFNVIIIVKEGEVSEGINLEEECGRIKKQLRRLPNLKQGKCRVTILTTKKSHDRHILTNYYRIKAGCGFNLCDKAMKENVSVDIKVATSPDYAGNTEGLIEFYQSVADNPNHVYGDKESNLLHF